MSTNSECSSQGRGTLPFQGQPVRLQSIQNGARHAGGAESRASFPGHPHASPRQAAPTGYLLSNSSSSSLEEEPTEKTVLDLGMSGEMLKEKEIRLAGLVRPRAEKGINVRHQSIISTTTTVQEKRKGSNSEREAGSKAGRAAGRAVGCTPMPLRRMQRMQAHAPAVGKGKGISHQVWTSTQAWRIRDAGQAKVLTKQQQGAPRAKGKIY